MRLDGGNGRRTGVGGPLSWLALAVIVLAGLEIWGIMRMSDAIGGMPTLLLLVLSGIAGAYAARKEGARAWNEARRLMASGRPPGHAMLDGLCVVAGGMLLLLPGFLSDIVGLTLLLPLTRVYYRALLLRWIERLLRNGSFTIRRF